MYSQNELYIYNNDSSSTKPTLYVKGAEGNVPTLFVNGEIINYHGVFQNENGIIELTGDFTNNVGIRASKYESTGTEIFSGKSNQTISGILNGDTSGNLSGVNSALNQLYNVKFDNSSTITLATDVNNHEDGSTEFVGNTIVLTGSNKYYIKNTNPAMLSGYGVAGDTVRFFEGELWRETTDGSSYDFPIGSSHSNSSSFGEGIQMASVNVSAATGNGALSSSFENGSPSITPIIICPGSPTAAAQDVDEILNNGFWTITNPDNNVNEYSITLTPADFTALGTPGDYTIIQNGGPTGQDDCTGNLTSLPITHSGLTSFSKFEIGGSTDGSPLPVELLSLEANPVNNEFIQVVWETATEINNEGFEVQRSINGLDFETIGYVEGNGNSSVKQFYNLKDKNVEKDITYYYRLKQIDFDGSFEYSSKVSASLNGVESDIFVSHFIPNPTSANSKINVVLNQKGLAKIVMFNALGQLVLNIDIPLSVGTTILPFDLENLSNGIYQTNIFIGEESFSRKLNISK